MSKLSKTKARARKAKYRKPSAPRAIGANDNNQAAVNDNAPLEIRGLRLSDGQRDRFARAELKIASPNFEARREGNRMMDLLDREIEEAIQAKLAGQGLEELRGLEKLRGFEIGVSTHESSRGAPRASRDGLETLLTTATITRMQHAAGLRYRADYELLDPEKGLTPSPIDQTRRIFRGGEGFAEKRTEREMFIKDLEAMIQEEDRTCLGPNGVTAVSKIGMAVWALRSIAGKGSNLRDLSGSGSTRGKIAKSLAVALDCAAIAYGLE